MANHQGDALEDLRNAEANIGTNNEVAQTRATMALTSAVLLLVEQLASRED